MTAAEEGARELGRERLRAVTSSTIGLGDQIYDSIGEAIVDGRLAPGERLSDRVLAEELGVSRTPIREALQRLEWLGLVEMSPSRFTRVTELSAELVASTVEYADLQAGVALRLAMRRMDDSQLDEAIVLLDRMIAATDQEDAEALALESRLFVDHLTTHSGNPVFARMQHQVALLVARSIGQAPALLGTHEFPGECYRQMRAAMQERDADAAERWFRAQHDQSAVVPTAD